MQAMSRIACIWADLGDDDAADLWYRDTHVPAVVASLNIRANHGQPAEDDLFKEVPSIQGTHMTVFELPENLEHEKLEAQIQPSLDKIPRDARFDTRLYKEHKIWNGEDWQGGEIPKKLTSI